MCILKTKTNKQKSPQKWNPQVERTKICSVSRIHRAPYSMETQLYKDKLNYLMLPFASQVKKKKKGYKVKYFKLFSDRNLLHN